MYIKLLEIGSPHDTPEIVMTNSVACHGHRSVCCALRCGKQLRHLLDQLVAKE